MKKCTPLWGVIFVIFRACHLPLAYYPPQAVDPYRLCALRLAHAFYADPRARSDTGCAETRAFRLVE